MPLFFQHTTANSFKLGIWYITEDEEFFLKEVPLQQFITHPHKRLQHLAGRYLLRHLYPDFPYNEILIADTRKPYLPNELYHFSISHCGNYAAAIVSKTQRVGIDIETLGDKVVRITHKFIHEKEIEFLNNSLQHVLNNDVLTSTTILWSAKEAVFKWYGLGKVDFKEHMQLSGNIIVNDEAWNLPFNFKKTHNIQITIQAKIFNELILSWINSDVQIV